MCRRHRPPCPVSFCAHRAVRASLLTGDFKVMPDVTPNTREHKRIING